VAASTSVRREGVVLELRVVRGPVRAGSSITSAWYTSTTATNTINGTSMASPHVAGVAALYKGTYGDASQATIDGWLKNNATANVITGNVSGTPNRLLFKASL
jgi:subtilisin family serine protease